MSPRLHPRSRVLHPDSIPSASVAHAVILTTTGVTLTLTLIGTIEDAGGAPISKMMCQVLLTLSLNLAGT